MRFFEFNQDKDLKHALMNVLMNMKGDADDKGNDSQISMDAVQGVLANTGYPAFNYDVFKRIYDTDDDLKNIVADFDQEKIVVKTCRFITKFTIKFDVIFTKKNVFFGKILILCFQKMLSWPS